MESIFDAAGNKSKSKKEMSFPPKLRKYSRRPSDNADLEEMLQKMHDMKKDLENQLAAIYLKGNEKKINVSNLIEKAKNVTAKQLEKMAEQEKILRDKIHAALPSESCIVVKLPGKGKVIQDRKGKLRGVRNKWIPVR